MFWAPAFSNLLDGPFFVTATRGAMTLDNFGMNLRTKVTIPSTDSNSLMVLGVGKPTTWYSFYAIVTGPNSIGGKCVSHVFNFSGFKLYLRWFQCEADCLQRFEQVFPQLVGGGLPRLVNNIPGIQQSSMYILYQDPLFGLKCAKANDFGREKRKGAFAIPKARRLETHCSILRDKNSLSLCAGRYWY